MGQVEKCRLFRVDAAGGRYDGAFVNNDAAEGDSVAELTQPEYTLINAQISFNSSSGKYSATLYSRNLTNRIIKEDVPMGDLVALEAPRTVGIVLTARF